MSRERNFWSSRDLTIGCTATDSPPLNGSKPVRESGVVAVVKAADA